MRNYKPSSLFSVKIFFTILLLALSFVPFNQVYATHGVVNVNASITTPTYYNSAFAIVPTPVYGGYVVLTSTSSVAEFSDTALGSNITVESPPGLIFNKGYSSISCNSSYPFSSNNTLVTCGIGDQGTLASSRLIVYNVGPMGNTSVSSFFKFITTSPNPNITYTTPDRKSVV